MLLCKYCNKVCKNKNSQSQHQIRCKLNGDAIIVSNWIKYNNKVKSGEIIKQNKNQYIKAKNNNLPKPTLSVETIAKIKLVSRKNAITQFKDEKFRKKFSEIMKNTVRKYPQSYSARNICGRTKSIDIIDSYGNNTKVNGSWELKVANYLNNNNIKWTNIIDGFSYVWNGSVHLYYPDFYLPEYNLYIEVKGYQRNRDLCKWEQFPHNIIIIKLNEIKNINNVNFNELPIWKGGRVADVGNLLSC